MSLLLLLQNSEQQVVSGDASVAFAVSAISATGAQTFSGDGAVTIQALAIDGTGAVTAQQQESQTPTSGGGSGSVWVAHPRRKPPAVQGIAAIASPRFSVQSLGGYRPMAVIGRSEVAIGSIAIAANGSYDGTRPMRIREEDELLLLGIAA